MIQTGEDTQREALTVVKDGKASAKRKLIEERMGADSAASKAAGKAITRPKAPDPLCAMDSLVDVIKEFLSADSASVLNTRRSCIRWTVTSQETKNRGIL